MDKEDVVCVYIYIYICVCIYIHTHTHTHIYIYIYIHKMEHYSAIKKNEIMPFAATHMNLEIIILSEISQRQIPNEITYM